MTPTPCPACCAPTTPSPRPPSASSAPTSSCRTRSAATPPTPTAPLVRQALAAYPPTAGSAVSAWSHHGLAESARALLPGAWPAAGDPDTGWTEREPWPRLSHQVSQLAALAVPGLAPGLEERLAARAVDLSRGFVRAVRRRDWLQAAGVGRWLARLPGVPDSLGLAAGLVFVGRWGAADPRVVLQVEAAGRLFGTGR
ncbi:hypothetical protein [Streptomyces sp. ST1020]|uniref:hypothetical protein n=1 Tax=Streptomyces sp. ST1020 TaxID=1848901 RepID=UPI0034C62996